MGNFGRDQDVCALLRLAHDILACSSAPIKRKWKGLTEKQVEEIAEYHGMDGLYETSVIDFYRAIELTLKEMNT